MVGQCTVMPRSGTTLMPHPNDSLKCRIDVLAMLRPRYDDFAGVNLPGHFRSPISRNSAIRAPIGTSCWKRPGHSQWVPHERHCALLRSSPVLCPRLNRTFSARRGEQINDAPCASHIARRLGCRRSSKVSTSSPSIPCLRSRTDWMGSISHVRTIHALANPGLDQGDVVESTTLVEVTGRLSKPGRGAEATKGAKNERRCGEPLAAPGEAGAENKWR